MPKSANRLRSSRASTLASLSDRVVGVMRVQPDLVARPDAPGASDASLGEMWYLGLLVGLLLWWGVLPGGPKLGGTVPLPFDEGIVNVVNNTTADIMSSYPVAATP